MSIFDDYSLLNRSLIYVYNVTLPTDGTAIIQPVFRIPKITASVAIYARVAVASRGRRGFQL